MFVTRNTYNAACRERDEALGLVTKLRQAMERESAALFGCVKERDEARAEAERAERMYQPGKLFSLGERVRLLEHQDTVSQNTIASLRDQLAKTWIRNDRGHWARHPLHAEAMSTAIVDGAAPSRAILGSELNKDRSGKHGSEVA